MTNQERLNDYIKADRAWKRPHRIAHARQQLAKAKLAQDIEEVGFWAAVIHTNTWRPYRAKV